MSSYEDYSSFRRMGYTLNGGYKDGLSLDKEKMKLHILDCTISLLKAARSCDERCGEAEVASHRTFFKALSSISEHYLRKGSYEESTDIVEKLFAAFPDDSKFADGRGWLPIHWSMAVGLDNEEEGIKALCRLEPLTLRRPHIKESTRPGNVVGLTPIDIFSMRKKQDLELIDFLELCNQRSFSPRETSRAPKKTIMHQLHLAATYSKSPEYVTFLLQSGGTDALVAKGLFAPYSPLGLLLNRRSDSPEVSAMIGILLNVNVKGPNTMAEALRDGLCALIDYRTKDQALFNRRFDQLVAAHPDICFLRDHNGRLPLHIACMRSAETFVIDRLVKANPQSVQSTDKCGWQPVRYAVVSSTGEVVDLLISTALELTRGDDGDPGDLSFQALANITNSGFLYTEDHIGEAGAANMADNNIEDADSSDSDSDSSDSSGDTFSSDDSLFSDDSSTDSDSSDDDDDDDEVFSDLSQSEPWKRGHKLRTLPIAHLALKCSCDLSVMRTICTKYPSLVDSETIYYLCRVAESRPYHVAIEELNLILQADPTALTRPRILGIKAYYSPTRLLVKRLTMLSRAFVPDGGLLADRALFNNLAPFAQHITSLYRRQFDCSTSPFGALLDLLAPLSTKTLFVTRLLLQGDTSADNAGALRNANYLERRMAMFLAFAAVSKDVDTPILISKLRRKEFHLLKLVISFI